MRRRGSDGLEGHLDGVRMLGEELARRHGISPARLAMAAHMHDWFRRVPPRKLKAILGKLGVRLDAETSRHPALWHGIVASECARRNAGISDRDILAAVRWHTTGHPVSTRLGRALFVADFCERNRGFREAGVGRRIAARNLEAAARYVMASKLAWLFECGIPPHSATLRAWKSAFRETFGA